MVNGESQPLFVINAAGDSKGEYMTATYDLDIFNMEKDTIPDPNPDESTQEKSQKKRFLCLKKIQIRYLTQ